VVHPALPLGPVERPGRARNEVEAFEFGYNVVNEDLARAVIDEIDGVEDPW
jgi:trehalose 6-phosphate synthase